MTNAKIGQKRSKVSTILVGTVQHNIKQPLGGYVAAQDIGIKKMRITYDVVVSEARKTTSDHTQNKATVHTEQILWNREQSSWMSKRLLIYAAGVSNKELVIVHTYCGSRRIGYKSRASQVITCEGSAPMGRHHLGQVKD